MDRTLFLLPIFILLTGCMTETGRYSDRTIEFASADKVERKIEPCNVTGPTVEQQTNPACIGKTLRSTQPNSGTIIILKPGPAMPVAQVEAESLTATRD